MDNILEFTVGKTSPITFPEGISIALLNEDNITVGIKAGNLKAENIEDFYNNEILLW